MELDRLIALVKEKGGRMTFKREVIFKVLLNNENVLITAEKLLKQCQKEIPSLNLTTVYRNLEKMIELGLVQQVNVISSKRAFKLVTLNSHHHHLICSRCKKTIPIDYCPITNELLEIAKSKNFKIADSNIEFFGLCQDCNIKTKL